MTLKEKVIVVTGASGLIGKAIVDRIRSYGGTCFEVDIQYTTDLTSHKISCDITTEDSVRSMVDSVIKTYGRIDGFVNAAYPRTKDWGNKFEEIKLESWRANVDFQMNSVFVMCQVILEQMKQQNHGSVVNLASTYGVVGPDFGVYKGTAMTMPAAYSAIKGGVINFTRYLASYYGSYSVRVNCVSPGGIFDNQNPMFVESYESKVPLKRMGKPDDIAGPVCFLLSDDSKYVTGHNLMVDGGWTAI